MWWELLRETTPGLAIDKLEDKEWTTALCPCSICRMPYFSGIRLAWTNHGQAAATHAENAKSNPIFDVWTLSGMDKSLDCYSNLEPIYSIAIAVASAK